MKIKLMIFFIVFNLISCTKAIPKSEEIIKNNFSVREENNDKKSFILDTDFWLLQNYLQLNNYNNIQINEFKNKIEIDFNEDNITDAVASLENNKVNLSLKLPYEFSVHYQKNNINKVGIVKFERVLDYNNLYDFKPCNFSLFVNDKWIDMYYYKGFYYPNHEKIFFTESLNNELTNVFASIVSREYSIYGYLLESFLKYFKVDNKITGLNEANYLIPNISISTNRINKYAIDSEFIYYGINGLWGIVDSFKQEILTPPFSYNMLYSLGEGCNEIVSEYKGYKFNYNDKFVGGLEHGFTDVELFIYKNELYTMMYPDDGIFTNKYDNKYYPIYNMTGYFWADSLTYGDNGLSYANNTGKYGIVSENGKIITGAIYDDVFNTEGEIIPVMKNGYWGYVNNNGEEIIPTEYEPVVYIRFGNYYPYPENGGYVVLKDKNNKFGVMDVYGNVVKDFVYDWGLPYKDGYLLREDGVWNYYEQNNKEAIFAD